jgi:hypothetical protein
LTFQGFGFSENDLNYDVLLSAAVAGKCDVPLGEVTAID